MISSAGLGISFKKRSVPLSHAFGSCSSISNKIISLSLVEIKELAWPKSANLSAIRNLVLASRCFKLFFNIGKMDSRWSSPSSKAVANRSSRLSFCDRSKLAPVVSPKWTNISAVSNLSVWFFSKGLSMGMASGLLIFFSVMMMSGRV